MEIFLGVLVSLVAQFTKKWQGAGEWGSLAIVALLALVSSAIYTWLSHAGYWESVQAILMTAGAFYAFIISRFPNASSEVKPE